MDWSLENRPDPHYPPRYLAKARLLLCVLEFLLPVIGVRALCSRSLGSDLVPPRAHPGDFNEGVHTGHLSEQAEQALSKLIAPLS